MNPPRRVLFIDTSYYVFYRYYAIVNWLRRFQPETPLDVSTLLQNDVFLDKYNKTFEDTLVALMKRWKIPGSGLFFAKDCPREHIWRMQHYAAYKAGREEKTDTFNKDIFRHTYDTLLPALKEKYGFQELAYDGLEADDIIALAVKHIRKDHPDCVVVVVTNDNDYIQLLDQDIILINLQQKMLQERITDTGSYLARKILMGDKSDNIPPIAKKCGEKTAERLVQEPSFLEKLLEQPDVKCQYELNKLLIDFNSIPTSLQQGFDEYFTGQVNSLKEC